MAQSRARLKEIDAALEKTRDEAAVLLAEVAQTENAVVTLMERGLASTMDNVNKAPVAVARAHKDSQAVQNEIKRSHARQDAALERETAFIERKYARERRRWAARPRLQMSMFTGMGRVHASVLVRNPLVIMAVTEDCFFGAWRVDDTQCTLIDAMPIDDDIVSSAVICSEPTHAADEIAFAVGTSGGAVDAYVGVLENGTDMRIRKTGRVQRNDGPIVCLEYSASAKHVLAMGMNDSAVRLYDIFLTPIGLVSIGDGVLDDPCLAIAASNASTVDVESIAERILVGSSARGAFWVAKGEEPTQVNVPGERQPVTCVSAAGELTMLGLSDGGILVYDLDAPTAPPLCTLVVPPAFDIGPTAVVSVVLLPTDRSGTMLVSADRDRYLTTWFIDTDSRQRGSGRTPFRMVSRFEMGFRPARMVAVEDAQLLLVHGDNLVATFSYTALRMYIDEEDEDEADVHAGAEEVEAAREAEEMEAERLAEEADADAAVAATRTHRRTISADDAGVGAWRADIVAESDDSDASDDDRGLAAAAAAALLRGAGM